MDDVTLIFDWPIITNDNHTENAKCEHSMTHAEEIGYVYIIPIICGLGIIYTIINIVVLSQRCLEGTPYTYLLALESSDLVTLMLVFPIGFVRCMSCNTQDSAGYGRRFYEVYIMLPFNNISATMSIWITMALAIERYLYVKRPLLSMKYCTIPNTRLIIAIIALGAITLNISYFIASKITDCNTYDLSEFGHSSLYIALSWIRALFRNFLPSLILTVLTCILIHSVCTWKIPHHDSEHRYCKEHHHIMTNHQLTMVLICIIFVSLLGNIPIAFAFRGVATPIFGNLNTDLYRNYRLVANILELVATSTNFIIYCTMDRRFKIVLKDVATRWCCPWKRRNL
ncbi:unnamed protein product, partial [Owenia fusiformis]